MNVSSHLLLPALAVSRLAAFNVASTSDAITKTMLAVLTLIAAAMVALGLARGWRGRRKAQVVIEDVIPVPGIPSSSTLSPQLRQAVRQAILQESRAGLNSVLETLDKDIKARLLRTSGSVQVNKIREELRSTTEDSLEMLAAGLRAVAPKEGAGLYAALSAALPAQRGWAIRVFPVSRGTESRPALGMAVELGQLGHPADSVATFWSSPFQKQLGGSDQASETAVENSLDQLLEPTALWIATRLVSRQLALSGAPRRRLLFSRGELSQELAGLQTQLAGQLALYAMRKQPDFAREFAQQALADLEKSQELIPDYFRSNLVEGAVRERLGWSYHQKNESGNAAKEFGKGVDSFDEAVKRLQEASYTDPGECKTALERLMVRRTMCRLLAGGDAHLAAAKKELVELRRITAKGGIDLYNGACLFAVAISRLDLAADEKLLFTGHAWLLLGRALVASGVEGPPWTLVMTDPEWDVIDEQQRRDFCEKLRAQLPKRGNLTGEREVMLLIRESLNAIGVAVSENNN